MQVLGRDAGVALSDLRIGVAEPFADLRERERGTPRAHEQMAGAGVGQPRDYDNRASYGVYDSADKRFEFKRIEYDIASAAHKVLQFGLDRNFARRLFIGV